MSPATPSRVLRLAELLAPPTQPAAEREEAVLDPIDPEAELRALRETAMAEARDAGLAEARRIAAAERDDALSRAQAQLDERHAALERELAATRDRHADLIAGLRGELDRLDARTAEDACVIAMAAVARVVGEQYGRGEAMASLCAELVATTRARPLVLSVAPDDEPLVREMASRADVTVATNAALSRGQCRLESPRGQLDTSLQTRLRAIADALALAVPAAAS